MDNRHVERLKYLENKGKLSKPEKAEYETLRELAGDPVEKTAKKSKSKKK